MIDPEKEGVLRSCEILHMCCNGSMGGVSDQNVSQIAEYLRKRLKHWNPTTLVKDRPYDEAVRQLVECALVSYVLEAGSLDS